MLPWRSRLQPYLSWYGLCGATFILLSGGFTIFIPGQFSVEDLFSSYASPIINIILFVAYKLIKRTKWVSLEEMPIMPWIIQYQNNPETPIPKRRGFAKLVNILW